jgi:hypothetical protein
LQEGGVQIKCYGRVNFLLIFANRQLANQVLHVAPKMDAGFLLVIQR